jgi:hypothetical protein
MAAGGPRRGCAPQAQAASQLFNICQRRRESIGHRLEFAEVKSPRGTKPPRCPSAELLFSCCVSIAALLDLANCNEHVAIKIYFAIVPANTQRALHGAHSSRDWSGKTNSFARSNYTRACHRHFLFPVKN